MPGTRVADKYPMVGTFSVEKCGKNTWRVMVATYADGRTVRKTVPKIGWTELGFSPAMSIEQARLRAKQLNAQNAVARRETSKVARIAQRAAEDALTHSAFVPDEINTAFLKYLDNNISGNGRIKARTHWAIVKKMVITLQLRPEDYADSKKQIYAYFSKKKYSPAYVKKLLRILNLHGRFLSRMVKTFYEPVPNPTGHEREKLTDIYLDKAGYFGPTEPLDPETLSDIKRNIPDQKYEWLFISVWLGLRPAEINAIVQDKARKCWRVEESETPVLWVYQAKLTSKPRQERWKGIPLFCPEMLEALSYVVKGAAEPPLTKTLKRLTGRQTTLYAGRKGFTDLMLSKGQALENIAQWLGHSTIETTWKHYKNKRRVHFSK